jgi:hypothetical protein
VHNQVRIRRAFEPALVMRALPCGP